MKVIEKYRCIKSFTVLKRDENDKVIENEGYEVNEGVVFEKSEAAYFSDVRLENLKGWVEVSALALEIYFEKIS